MSRSVFFQERPSLRLKEPVPLQRSNPLVFRREGVRITSVEWGAGRRIRRVCLEDWLDIGDRSA